MSAITELYKVLLKEFFFKWDDFFDSERHRNSLENKVLNELDDGKFYIMYDNIGSIYSLSIDDSTPSLLIVQGNYKYRPEMTQENNSLPPTRISIQTFGNSEKVNWTYQYLNEVEMDNLPVYEGFEKIHKVPIKDISRNRALNINYELTVMDIPFSEAIIPQNRQNAPLILQRFYRLITK